MAKSFTHEYFGQAAATVLYGKTRMVYPKERGARKITPDSKILITLQTNSSPSVSSASPVLIMMCQTTICTQDVSLNMKIELFVPKDSRKHAISKYYVSIKSILYIHLC